MIFRVRGMGDGRELPSSDLTLDPYADAPEYGPPLSAATLPNTEPPPFEGGLPSATELSAFMSAPAVTTSYPTPTAATAALYGPPAPRSSALPRVGTTAPLLSLPSPFGVPFVAWLGVGALGALALFAGRGAR